MLRRIGIITTLFSAMLAGLAGSKTVPDRPKVAVVIDQDTHTPADSVSGEFGRVVTSVMHRYCQYILYHCTDRVELLSELPHVDSGRHVWKHPGSSFEELLHITVAADVYLHSTAPANESGRSDRKKSGLGLNLHTEHSRLKEAGPALIQQSDIRVNSRRTWLADRLAGDTAEDTAKFGGIPEPWEQVLQRAAEAALAVLPRRELRTGVSGDPIQLVLYVDSAYIGRYGEAWLEQAEAVVEVASGLLLGRFGYRLRLASLRTMKVEQAGGRSLSQLQSALRPHLDLGRDTLIVTILANIDPISYLKGERLFEVGVAKIGRNRILLNDLPRVSGDNLFWQPFLSGRTFLHEIGHSFGAIHVSDQNSVMSHEVTWLAADQFDPLNDQIVRAALSSKLVFDDPVVYLAFVSNAIAETGYNLADYPAFFYDFIHYGNDSLIASERRAAIERESYLVAIDAYGYLSTGDKYRAAELFGSALESDPRQASLWYYLALSTTGAQSRQAMKRAAGLGYLDARILLGQLHGLRIPRVDWQEPVR